jgi:hypothetical protein
LGVVAVTRYTPQVKARIIREYRAQRSKRARSAILKQHSLSQREFDDWCFLFDGYGLSGLKTTRRFPRASVGQ